MDLLHTLYFTCLDSGETSRPKEGTLQGPATPERKGSQSSRSTGACGTSADEIPSKRDTEGR